MKVMLTRFLHGLILTASVLLPTFEAVGQGGPPPGGSAGYAGTYPYAPAYYSNPSFSYQSQTAYQTASQRSAATTVLENSIGYSVRAPFGPRLGFNAIFGNRRGIDGNDYSVSGFFPWHIDPNRNVVFGVVRGTTTDLGDFVGNFGIGQRYFFEDLNRIVGASVWYDVDDTHNQTYYRAGAQLEYIGRYLEIRSGVDVVLDTNQTQLASGFSNAAPVFQGNNVVFNFATTRELAYDQGYLEAGGPMPFLGRYGVNAYAGAYYVWNDNAQQALGWTLRTSAAITRDVQVGMNFTNDEIFGSNTSVNVSIAFPTGGLAQVFRSSRTIVRGQTPNLSETNQVLALRPGSVASQMGVDVVRNHRMPVDIDTSVNQVLAIDAVNGLPVCITHVDPNAAAQGTGTFENPFQTLEAARVTNNGSCRIIRVIPRSDGTGTNLALAATFNLFANQRLLGSSFNHLFGTTRGLFTLPGFTGAGPGPLVTSAVNGNLISMGNNTEVSGMQLVGSATGNAIVGSPVGFNINRNTIRSAMNGVLLTNASGTGLVDQNTITASTVDGVNVTVTAGNQLNLTASNNTITGSGDDGADVTATGSPLVALFTGNKIGGSGDNGLVLTSTGGSNVTATLTGNAFGDGLNITGNGVDGFFFTANSGSANIVIGGPNAADGNTFIGNGDDGVDFNLTGTALATLLAQNNTTISGATQLGLNFTGSAFGNTNVTGIPPDTNGGVGPNHIVEFINTRFTVYNKTTGAQIQTSSLNQFFIDAGLVGVAGTFDPRIIYDPQSGRWFATAIDGGVGNTIFVAVSNTNDPTAGWKAVQFVGDVNNNRFNDFDTLGIDADGLYIATNNFLANNSFADVSLYSIPKADLLLATPSIANLTRFENQNVATVGFTPQPVVDFGASDGSETFLSASTSGQLNRTNITGTGTGTVALAAAANIVVPAFATAPSADQPGPKLNLENVSPRIQSNVVKVGNSLWAVHVVADPTSGRSAIRYYEINETTNALIQTGLITDPNLDFIEGSIAVNAAGNIVIGFTGSGANQFASAMAVTGNTSGGVASFNAPVVLQAGVSDYFVDFGAGRNRWGDYSATVVDPVDSSSFWTFQQFVNATDSYAIQITQLRVGAGGNTGDGISITATGTSMLTSATIDNNTLTDNNGAGLRMTANAGGLITNALITNNTATRNGTGAFLTSSGAGGSTITALVNNNTFDMNTGTNTGFHALATGTGAVVNINSFMNNTASNNNNGNGVRLEALLSGRVNVANFTGNTASNNGMNGLFVRSNGTGSSVNGAIGINGAAMNTFNSNAQAGIQFEATSGGSILGPFAVGNFAVVNNTIGATGAGNTLGGIIATVDSNIAPPTNSVLNLAIGGPTAGDGNSIVANMDAGIIFRTRTFALGTTLIQNNTISGTLDNATTMNPTDPMGDGIFLDRSESSLLTAMVLNNMSTGNANDGLRVLARGTDPTAANQPMTGTANTVTFNSNTFTGNMRHGASFSPQANAVVVGNGMLNTMTGNTMDGIHIATSGNGSFGVSATVRSTFDGNTLSTNMDDGLEIVSIDSSRVFLSVQSSNAVGMTPIIGMTTTIRDNLGDGIAINHTSNQDSNIIVQSDPLVANTMFRTLITNNGDATVAGGNGILIDNAAGNSTFTVQRTDITSNNVFVDPMMMVFNVNGNGLELNTTGGNPTFVVGSTVAELGNLVQSNGDDGLDISITSGNPIYTVARNTFGAAVGQLTGGNLGNGITVAASGTNNSPVLTFRDNQITRNNLRGVNIRVRGSLGVRGGNNVGATARFIFDAGGGATTGNVISANGQEGIFYEADPGIHQQRRVTLANAGFAGNNRPAPFSAFSPFVEGVGGVLFPGALDTGQDYFPTNALGTAAFLNLDTNNNSFLQITNNTVQNNGTAGTVGDGVFVRVGTNAYVAADVRSNTFGGNLLDDFRTESFITRDNTGNAIQTNASVNRTGATAVDDVFLDDTAQLDLRFNSNTGNQINVTALGATFAPDNLKITGDPGRFVGVFQVDNGPGLNAANTFTQGMMTQNINTAFGGTTGAFSLRGAADGLFPNVLFPDDFPGGTGSAPFLP